ncbi:VTC domain-containing protein [Flagellimonas flava]|uniref:VTC domain-containing protein n=1 Tax=Flagellimonas flava TaxID=570519 RepID=A0A1M5L3B0_9FLAO|nr:VTC domain-containing protein [Allomuricauda flava]SHG58903.1 VTC domain-containing protein [Allomuricauda flava]
MVKAVNRDFNQKSQFKNLRFERKFIFQHLGLEDLIRNVVFTNSFGFEEIYTRRTVNNIYFDDNNFSFYKQNVAGDERREKYRLRWYNDVFSEIQSPTLEIKRKYGEVGDKISYKMDGFKADLNNLNLDAVTDKIVHALKEKGHVYPISRLQSLFPALYNSYERRYFLSHCQHFRITVDFNMAFFNPHFQSNYRVADRSIHDIVLELKYGREHDAESRILSQQIGARLSKNSKYVRGMDCIHS